MKKKGFLTGFLGILLIGGLLLGAGSFAIAAGDSPGFFGARKAFSGDFKGAKKGMPEEEISGALEKLQSEGVITAEQAESIKSMAAERIQEREAWLKEAASMSPEERQALRDERQAKKPLLSEAVERGIITSEQAENIMKAMQELRQEQRKQEVETRLKELVANGTITQEQADAVIAKMEEEMKERQAEIAKRQQMPREEWREYVKNREKPQILRGLVDEGVITLDQAADIAQSLRPEKAGRGMGKGRQGRCPGNCFYASNS
ncbi:hypothetical protein [Thermosyntropha sp.]|uniref:hypothetical protein n=1 Tax=Thermosyntropha sp. TaxID=2740820 RepID=UPI0025EB29A4|nr:hypothetical protein [Thermosyntropha sp.]MBO8158973.1 hypothetical protein [Thermosyntropha sp.]